MSIEVVAWALNEARVEDPGTAAVLVGLANHADPDGTNAWPSVDRLAYYARMSPRSVRRHLGKLIADGVIAVDEDTRVRDAKTRADQRPTVYRLLMDGKSRETYEERRDRQRRETEEALRGGTDCPGGQDDRADNDDSTGGHGVPQPVLEPSVSPSPTEREPAGAREDDDQLALVPPAEPAPKGKRRTRIPEDWQPDAALGAWAREHFPAIDLDHEVAQFRDYWLARGDLGADWPARFRTWVRKARKFSEQRGGGRGGRRPVYRNDQWQDGSAQQGWDEFREGGTP